MRCLGVEFCKCSWMLIKFTKEHSETHMFLNPKNIRTVFLFYFANFSLYSVCWEPRFLLGATCGSRSSRPSRQHRCSLIANSFIFFSFSSVNYDVWSLFIYNPEREREKLVSNFRTAGSKTSSFLIQHADWLLFSDSCSVNQCRWMLD